MNNIIRIFVALLGVLSLLSLISAYGVTTNIVHVQAKSPWSNGFWQKKMSWKPRWVKTWQEKKIYVAVWKKVWGPVEVNEWVPMPKSPPGWSKHH